MTALIHPLLIGAETIELALHTTFLVRRLPTERPYRRSAMYTAFIFELVALYACFLILKKRRLVEYIHVAMHTIEVGVILVLGLPDITDHNLQTRWTSRLFVLYDIFMYARNIFRLGRRTRPLLTAIAMLIAVGIVRLLPYRRYMITAPTIARTRPLVLDI